jgi:hypothetical protein
MKVHSDVQSEFTLDDMLKVNDKTAPFRLQPGRRDDNGLADSYQEPDEDMKRLQERIRTTREREDSVLSVMKEKMNRNEPRERVGLSSPSKQNVSSKKNTKQETAKDTTSLTGDLLQTASNRFFTPSKTPESRNTISATVHGEQVCHDVSTIKHRL